MDGLQLEQALASASSHEPWLLVVDDASSGHLAALACDLLIRISTCLGAAPGAVAVAGRVEGLATELVLLGDVVIAAPRSSLRGGQGRAHLLPGTPWRLTERCGAGGALAFWTDRRAWSARRAREVGLVDRIATHCAAAAATLLESWSDGGAAASLSLIRRCSPPLGQSGALALERALFGLSFASEHPRSSAQAFFDRGRRGPAAGEESS